MEGTGGFLCKPSSVCSPDKFTYIRMGWGNITQGQGRCSPCPHAIWQLHTGSSTGHDKAQLGQNHTSLALLAAGLLAVGCTPYYIVYPCHQLVLRMLLQEGAQRDYRQLKQPKCSAGGRSRNTDGRKKHVSRERRVRKKGKWGESLDKSSTI